MSQPVEFPHVQARDLEGLDVALPEAFAGGHNVVLVAFHRRHQTLVDSWVSWLEDVASRDPELRFYEVPVLGGMWSPVRPFIDGGMAAAIRDPIVLRRTLTIYGSVSNVMKPLGIVNRSTIALFVLDRSGLVSWSGRGGFNESTARELAKALQAV